jgi:hypothetical protein
VGVLWHDVPVVAQDRSDDVVGVEGVETSTERFARASISLRPRWTQRARAHRRGVRDVIGHIHDDDDDDDDALALARERRRASTRAVPTAEARAFRISSSPFPR